GQRRPAPSPKETGPPRWGPRRATPGSPPPRSPSASTRSPRRPLPRPWRSAGGRSSADRRPRRALPSLKLLEDGDGGLRRSGLAGGKQAHPDFGLLLGEDDLLRVPRSERKSQQHQAAVAL